MVQPFPIISVEGTPYECGLQHGGRRRRGWHGSLEAHRRAIAILFWRWTGAMPSSGRRHTWPSSRRVRPTW